MKQVLIFLLLISAACSNGLPTQKAKTQAAPIAITHQDCAACGMVVREQPTPRAQAVHRDGTRVYFCSIGDLLMYSHTPSPHGGLTTTWAEMLGDDFIPRDLDISPMPWLEADRATFVVGIDRPQVMGQAVLAYPTQNLAQAVAAKYGGKTVDWQDLTK